VVDEYLMGRKMGRNSGEKLKKKECENRRGKEGRWCGAAKRRTRKTNAVAYYR